jgi:hypothetical protein
MRTGVIAVVSVGVLSATVLAQAPVPPEPGTPPAGATAPAAPAAEAKAQAQNCKDIVTAKARSAAQLSDASRERRARQNAIDNWRRRARDTYGWRYRFWSKAQEKQIKCGGGASAKHCTVRARPCRLL